VNGSVRDIGGIIAY